jgi:hypothetical protein
MDSGEADDDIFDTLSGLVRDYAPFILSQAFEFSKLYPWLPLREIEVEAVRLARIAEARFKPELGNDFSTFCGFYLKGLSRFAKRHPAYLSRPKERPPAISRAHPSVKQMLMLIEGDPDHVRIVIEYKPAATEGDGDIANLHHVAAGRRDRYAQGLLEAVPAERVRCSKNEAAILHWIEGGLAGTDDRRAVDVAKNLGLTKGAVSKIRGSPHSPACRASGQTLKRNLRLKFYPAHSHLNRCSRHSRRALVHSFQKGEAMDAHHDKYLRVTVCMPATVAEAARTAASKQFCSLSQVYRNALVADLRKRGLLAEDAAGR